MTVNIDSPLPTVSITDKLTLDVNENVHSISIIEPTSLTVNETVNTVTVNKETLTVTIPQETVTVITVGEQGPPGTQGPIGPPGVDGDKYYEFIKSVPAAIWTINHSLNKNPSITVVDSSGATVIGDYKYNSLSQVVLMFSAAFSGVAYLN